MSTQSWPDKLSRPKSDIIGIRQFVD